MILGYVATSGLRTLEASTLANPWIHFLTKMSGECCTLRMVGGSWSPLILRVTIYTTRGSNLRQRPPMVASKIKDFCHLDAFAIQHVSWQRYAGVQAQHRYTGPASPKSPADE